MSVRDWFRFGRGARADFTKQAADPLYGSLPAGSDVRGAVDAIGRRALAEQLAGTTDRKSRAYKNARDYVSRHLAGRRTRVNPEYQRKIERAVRSERKRELRAAGPITVAVTGTIRVSKQGRYWTGNMRATLDGDALRDYLDALARDDGKEALGIVLDKYGLNPESVAEVRDITGVEYQ